MTDTLAHTGLHTGPKVASVLVWTVIPASASMATPKETETEPLRQTC